MLSTAAQPTMARHLSSSTSDEQSSAQTQTTSLVDELNRLETQLPWWQSALLRLSGTFTDTQWQAAAGGDMYMNVLKQAVQPALISHGMFPDRFYTRLQMRGLHCWLAHVRLRVEPRDRVETLYREMMEHVWDQASLDLSRELGFGYVELSKHLKHAQFSWHGCCKALDAALLEESPHEAVTEVLLRNLYVDPEGEPLLDDTGAPDAAAKSGASWLAQYLLAQRDHLATLSSEEVLKGRLTWAELPGDGTAEAEASAEA